MRKIFVIAGHDKHRDPGAQAYDKTFEADIALELRDIVTDMLAGAFKKRGSECETVSLSRTDDTTMIQVGDENVGIQEDLDSMNLLQTIQYVRKYGDQDDFLLDIHFNHNHPTATGTEVFHAHETSQQNKAMAAKLSKAVADQMYIANRGAKSERLTAVGSLGILNRTPMPALLLDVCFLNQRDLPQYHRYKEGVAAAICDFIIHDVLQLPR